MAQLTTEQFIKQQREKIALLMSGKAIAIAAQDTHVKMVERIFEDGETSNGNKLGYNTEDPLYVNPNDSPKKFPTKGKTGKSKFSNGEPHKTGYFGSYREYRQKIGRQAGFMDLQLFGNLRNDFSKGVVKLDSFTFVSTITNEANREKFKKFQAYFKLSKEEREHFKQVLTEEILRILR